jgi:hypothetical protein
VIVICDTVCKEQNEVLAAIQNYSPGSVRIIANFSDKGLADKSGGVFWVYGDK